jgi:hypothetical protein
VHVGASRAKVIKAPLINPTINTTKIAKNKALAGSCCFRSNNAFGVLVDMIYSCKKLKLKIRYSDFFTKI